MTFHRREEPANNEGIIALHQMKQTLSVRIKCGGPNQRRGCEGMRAEASLVLDFLRPFASRQKDKNKADTFNGFEVDMSLISKGGE